MRNLARLIDTDDAGVGLACNGTRQLQRVSFHREVDFDDWEPAQHVAHRAARQENTHIGVNRCCLYFRHHPALVRAQMALEHKHVVAHRSALKEEVVGCRLYLRTWVMVIDSLSQSRTNYVRINLRGGNVRVAEHRLHASEVGAALEQMRRKGVAENVRREVVKNTGLAAISAQELPKSLPRHGAAAGRYEQVGTGTPLQQEGPRRVQIDVHRLDRRRPDRNQAVFVALAQNSDAPLLQLSVRDADLA